MSSEQLPTDAMTVKEAAACWPDSRRDYLKRFGENFGVPLRDLHIGHIRTYQDERAAEVPPLTVELELDALRSLLQELGLGAEIERLYRPLQRQSSLSLQQIAELPEWARRHISDLQLSEMTTLRQENENLRDRVRKANWARSR